jgi:hypothetical protein
MILPKLTPGRGILALLLLTGSVYVNSLGGEFIIGDDYNVYWNNPRILTETVSGAFRLDAYQALPQKHPYYRPLAFLAHSWLARITGRQPFGLHLASVLFHAAAGVLSFLLLAGFFEMRVAWLAAALFLVHPLHVEAVAWMAGFPEVLAGTLAMLSLYCLVRAPGISDFGLRVADCERARNPQFFWLVLACVAAALACLAKETALALPLLAVLFAGRRAWPLFAIAAGTLLARMLVLGAHSASLPPRPVTQHLRILAAAAVHYAKKLVWPWPVAPEYELGQATWIWLLVLTGCALAAWLACRRADARLAVLMIPASLAPALAASIVFFSDLRFVGDRFAYLAVLGVALLVALAARRAAGLVLALALLGVWSGMSALAARDWGDSERLWAHALRVTPRSKTAVLALGECYYTTFRFEDAARVYRHGLQFRPGDRDYLDSLRNVGRLPASATDKGTSR